MDRHFYKILSSLFTLKSTVEETPSLNLIIQLAYLHKVFNLSSQSCVAVCQMWTNARTEQPLHFSETKPKIWTNGPLAPISVNGCIHIESVQNSCNIIKSIKTFISSLAKVTTIMLQRSWQKCSRFDGKINSFVVRKQESCWGRSGLRPHHSYTLKCIPHIWLVTSIPLCHCWKCTSCILCISGPRMPSSLGIHKRTIKTSS